MRKELRQLIKAATAQGFTHKVLSNGHVRFHHPVTGDSVTVFGSTPSDHRSWDNSLSALRRAGFKEDRNGQRKGKGKKSF